jgi:hypothetical protein
MNLFRENIEKQFKFSQGKNLFHRGSIKESHFIPGTINAIEKLAEMDAVSENVLIDYTTNRALEEFYSMNQYYTFDAQSQKSLQNLYAGLFSAIRNNPAELASIAEWHLTNLKNWLSETNPFAAKLYESKSEIIEPVACSEYSPELQINILQIDKEQIIGPILDIGCGKQGNLVKYFRHKGIEAFGIDRLVRDDLYLYGSDWMAFEYGVEKWGTITSNLGFSNHFNHHHLRNDGCFIAYAKKYIDILNSLKIGGSFHYAPDLPFIEQYLNKEKYRLTKRNVGEENFSSVKIKRLK